MEAIERAVTLSFETLHQVGKGRLDEAPQDEVTGRGRRCPLYACSLLRLKLDERGAVVAADPERHRGRRVVDEDAADVGRLRQQVLDELAGLRVEPHHPVV